MAKKKQKYLTMKEVVDRLTKFMYYNNHEKRTVLVNGEKISDIRFVWGTDSPNTVHISFQSEPAKT